MAKTRQRHCLNCNSPVLATADEPNHVLHLIITLMSMGLWFPVWLIISATNNKFRCSKCGGLVN